MEQGTTRRSMPVGAVLAIVGGVLLAIGSFLPWAALSGVIEGSASGTDGTDGKVTLIAGIVALGCGVLAMRAGRRLLAILAILAGLLGAGIGLYDALTAEDSIRDDFTNQLVEQTGLSPAEGKAAVDAAIDSGELSISISVGLYVVIGGGLLALVGGILLLGGKGASSAAPAEPAGFATAVAASPPLPAEMSSPPTVSSSDLTPPDAGPGEVAPPTPPPPPAPPPSP
jgi:hypothetical protein